MSKNDGKQFVIYSFSNLKTIPIRCSEIFFSNFALIFGGEVQFRSKTTLLKAFFHTKNFTPLFGAETERTPRDVKQVPFVDLITCYRTTNH